MRFCRNFALRRNFSYTPWAYPPSPENPVKHSSAQKNHRPKRTENPNQADLTFTSEQRTKSFPHESKFYGTFCTAKQTNRYKLLKNLKSPRKRYPSSHTINNLHPFTSHSTPRMIPSSERKKNPSTRRHPTASTIPTTSQRLINDRRSAEAAPPRDSPETTKGSSREHRWVKPAIAAAARERTPLTGECARRAEDRLMARAALCTAASVHAGKIEEERERESDARAHRAMCTPNCRGDLYRIWDGRPRAECTRENGNARDRVVRGKLSMMLCPGHFSLFLSREVDCY